MSAPLAAKSFAHSFAYWQPSSSPSPPSCPLFPFRIRLRQPHPIISYVFEGRSYTYEPSDLQKLARKPGGNVSSLNEKRRRGIQLDVLSNGGSVRPSNAERICRFRSLQHIQHLFPRVLKPLDLLGITLVTRVCVEDTSFHLLSKDFIWREAIQLKCCVNAHEGLHRFVKGRGRLCRPLCRLPQ